MVSKTKFFKSGKALAREYGIVAEHALYRKTGDWYHLLNRFPAVLIDQDGYTRFSTEADYRRFVDEEDGVVEDVKNNMLTIKGGIVAWPGYTKFPEPTLQPEEVELHETFYEGAAIQMSVNRYERNLAAREKCLDNWKTSCIICGFDFGQHYGETVQGFIHVHHIKALSAVKKKYRLDPIKDLRPVCPNCHAVLHSKIPQLSIEEVKKLLKK